VAVEGFTAAMQRQREEARRSWVGSGEAATEAVWFALREEVGATEFLGYETEVAEGVVSAIVRNGERVTEAEAGDEIGVIVNQTPFYAESGGQVGDTGVVFSSAGAELAVRDTVKKAGDLHVHLGTLTHGSLKVGEAVELRVDGARRRLLRANHSVTHLLHEALRRRLGEHVTQKGSLVASDRLRFDFSHPRPLTQEDIRAIEAEVNERIRANSAVRTRLLTPDRAVAEGALALFGEKYGDEVRVVAMGGEHDEARPFSVELCGGTHVGRTGDIGLFKIVGETAIASGVRRIEALTGAAAEVYLAKEEGVLREAATALRTTPSELPARIVNLVEERRRLERELSEARRALANAGPSTRSAEKRIGDIAFDGRVVDGVPGRELKSLADDLKRRIGSGVVAAVSRADGKAAIVVGVTDDLTGRFDAVELVRLAAEALGGKGGGGRADMAQAGGPDASRAEAALAAVERAIAAKGQDQAAE
jgi:alanyl-tRNA synthetase